MKKVLVLGAAFALIASTVSADIKLTNTFGGNEDYLGGNDFMSWNRKADDATTTDRDEAEEFQSSYDVSVNDRLQADVSCEKFDGRIRLEFENQNLSGKNSQARLRGYGRFTPIEQIQFAAGNEFFDRFAIPAAYLAATDDTYTYGVMASSGLAFCANVSGFRFVADLAGDSKADDAENLGLNFGFDGSVGDVVNMGATFKNVTSENPTFGVFAGHAQENFILNAGYIYDNIDIASYTSAVGMGTKVGWKHTMQASVGYGFTDIGLVLAADVISGLTNECIIDGDTEKMEYDDKDLYPFYTKIAAGYGLTENLKLNGSVSLFTIIGLDYSAQVTVFPSVEYTLPENMGSLIAGVRLAFNDAKENDGLQKITIPLCWQWTILDSKSSK